MTPDSLSDLVLFGVCAVLLHRNLSSADQSAGWSLTLMLIGMAALVGALRFSTFTTLSEQVKGVHQFLSLFAAVGAFPLWAYTLAYPSSALARRFAGAWWLTFVVGGMGIGIWTLGLKLWGQAVPVLGGLWMTRTVWKQWRGMSLILGTAGLVSLFSSFTVAVVFAGQAHVIGFVTRVQLLHYLLALALLLLFMARPIESSASVHPHSRGFDSNPRGAAG